MRERWNGCNCSDVIRGCFSVWRVLVHPTEAVLSPDRFVLREFGGRATEGGGITSSRRRNLEPDTPFAALTLIGAPALLTNATSVLLLSTSNRLNRTIVRARELAAEMDASKGTAGGEGLAYLSSQLDAGETRVLITVRAMTLLYSALGLFVASTLAAFIGAIAAPSEGLLLSGSLMMTIVTGGIGFLGLVLSAAILVRESQLAYRMLRAEANRARARRLAVATY